mmetsp:Transcript_19336/g.46102  ORF Transcript_19336/g.46102 Transcript_19336/m.46102 type:complete len:241 (-) Transcript_19336:2542-3264(-)
MVQGARGLRKAPPRLERGVREGLRGGRGALRRVGRGVLAAGRRGGRYWLQERGGGPRAALRARQPRLERGRLGQRLAGALPVHGREKGLRAVLLRARRAALAAAVVAPVGEDSLQGHGLQERVVPGPRGGGGAGHRLQRPLCAAAGPFRLRVLGPVAPAVSGHVHSSPLRYGGHRIPAAEAGELLAPREGGGRLRMVRELPVREGAGALDRLQALRTGPRAARHLHRRRHRPHLAGGAPP